MTDDGEEKEKQLRDDFLCVERAFQKVHGEGGGVLSCTCHKGNCPYVLQWLTEIGCVRYVLSDGGPGPLLMLSISQQGKPQANKTDDN